MTNSKDREPVTKIIDASLEQTAKGEYLVIATGQVPTRGWDNPVLVAHVYIQPPADGIYDYTFLATPPSGPVQQVLSRIEVKETVAGPEGFQGVRIHSATDSLVVKLREQTAQA